MKEPVVTRTIRALDVRCMELTAVHSVYPYLVINGNDVVDIRTSDREKFTFIMASREYGGSDEDKALFAEYMLSENLALTDERFEDRNQGGSAVLNLLGDMTHWPSYGRTTPTFSDSWVGWFPYCTFNNDIAVYNGEKYKSLRYPRNKTEDIVRIGKKIDPSYYDCLKSLEFAPHPDYIVERYYIFPDAISAKEEMGINHCRPTAINEEVVTDQFEGINYDTCPYLVRTTTIVCDVANKESRLSYFHESDIDGRTMPFYDEFRNYETVKARDEEERRAREFERANRRTSGWSTTVSATTTGSYSGYGDPVALGRAGIVLDTPVDPSGERVVIGFNGDE